MTGEETGDDTCKICVLQLSGTDPMTDEWVFKGAVNTEHPGLDGTVLPYKGELYFFYSGYGWLHPRYEVQDEFLIKADVGGREPRNYGRQ